MGSCDAAGGLPSFDLESYATEGPTSAGWGNEIDVDIELDEYA
jgi:hypothetical protein